MSILERDGKTWFYRLVPGQEAGRRSLLDRITPTSLANKVVICQTPKFIDDRELEDPVRNYTIFRDYVEFYRFFRKTQPCDRSFYEVIIGELPQKPHFDIDITADKLGMGEKIEEVAQFILDNLITAIRGALYEVGIQLILEKDILLFSSACDQKKHSYHLLIDNYCHSGNDEARAFYQKVIEIYKVLSYDRHTDKIDLKVYSPRQCFRTLGSHKFSSDRVKMFDETFRYRGDSYRHQFSEQNKNPELAELDLMKHSLVSFTAGCRFLPSWIPEKAPRTYEENELQENDVKKAVKLLHRRFRGVFSLTEVKDNIMVLKREAPSHCPLCDRIHENENPFMFVRDGHVYWNCRRNVGKFDLGQISDPIVQPVQPEEIRITEMPTLNPTPLPFCRGIDIAKAALIPETLDTA